jgi:biotin operon repressor
MATSQHDDDGRDNTRHWTAVPAPDDQPAAPGGATVERWQSPDRRARFLRSEHTPQGVTPQMALLLQLGRALDDPTRVLILALLAEAPAPLYGQEIAARLKVSPQTISHHLHILQNGGLVREQREGAYRYYQLDRDQIQRTAEQAFSDDHLGLPSAAEERAVMLATYLRDGRLFDIPARRDALRFVLEEVAHAFAWGQLYDEREVNAILKGFHDDTARLRRGLVDEGIMLREHGRYWLVRPHEEAVTPEQP